MKISTPYLQCLSNKTHPTGKKQPAAGKVHRTFYDRKNKRVRDLSCGNRRVYLDLEIRRVFCLQCNKVKQENLPFLADNPFYTKRFAFYVGKRCNSQTIKDVAAELHLD